MNREVMSAEEYRKRFLGGVKPKRHKYNAKAVKVDGFVFASQAEANRYVELRLRRKAKEIASLVLQPVFELQPAFVRPDGRRERAIAYVADFGYVERPSGVMVVEDVKGLRTDVYRLKRKLFLYRYPNVEFREIG